MFVVEASAIRQVHYTQSSQKLASSNVCEDRRNILPPGIKDVSYNEIYLCNGKTLCIINVVDNVNYKIYYSISKLTDSVIELSIIEDKSVIRFDNQTIKNMGCSLAIDEAKSYTYTYIIIIIIK